MTRHDPGRAARWPRARAAAQALLVLGAVGVVVLVLLARSLWIPTWRTDSKIQGLPVDLDHVLAGRGLVVDERRSVGIPGSDHRGLVARVRRAAPSGPP